MIKWNTKIIYFACLIILIACTKANKVESSAISYVSYLDTITDIYAGKPVDLRFIYKGDSAVHLIIKNSYVQTIQKPLIKEDTLIFNVDDRIIKKAGLCEWQLVHNGISLESGIINILPINQSHNNLESYLGPRSIVAGGHDFSMLVVVPTDIYDNPLINGSSIIVSEQFKNRRNKIALKTNDFLVHHNIFSTKQTGPFYIAAATTNGESKEMESSVTPAIPDNFNIYSKCNHNYADGNQLMEIYTSQIKDIYNNTISDGTIINFTIHSNKDQFFSASGTTINGKANVKFLHPSEAQYWKIKAYVDGASSSNTIKVNFKQSTLNYQLSYDTTQRILKIHSILSYMGQKLPDGNIVECRIINKQGNVTYETEVDTQGGTAFIDLSTHFFDADVYVAEIILMGIKKTIQIEIYDDVY
ncbi:hypothetical protein [Saccharicrinis aurantiacus]|uniref:hypothetical protein n=1 Tax=Saccharicrinis aurantiacus TaxID=1849719 RepID=UPI0024927042|nr:hypothetical protein [Saccharicrinis aurantiacus]